MDSGDHIVDMLSAESPAASVIANKDRSVILVRSFFPATEGVVEPGSHLKIGVCMSGGGQVRYGIDDRPQRWHWHRGDLLMTVPNDNSAFASPDVDMIGLAVDLQDPAFRRDTLSSLLGLANLSSRVMTDEVIRSVIVALWACAEYHGTNSAFIDEGINIVLQRLAGPSQGLVSRTGPDRPLSPRQVDCVSGYIRSRLGHDIRVPELAALVGMEPRRFSRALRATTRHAPYAYLTCLRMEHARKLLDSGESVIDTALLVGYTNPGKFSAAFRRLVGCTPSQWKRRRHPHVSGVEA